MMLWFTHGHAKDITRYSNVALQEEDSNEEDRMRLESQEESVRNSMH